MQSETQPLISVIVPIYKVERYLDDCIQSIINQTYRNIEILLIDDGSPDNCPALCDEWANKDSRITVYHKPNGGLADARNYGLDRANGAWIYCVDSDDWIEPDLLELTYGKAHANNSDIVSFGYRWANDDGTEFREAQDTLRMPSEGRRTSDEALTELWSNKVQNYAWSFLIRSDVYEGIRFPTGMLMEDVGTTYRLFGNADHVYFLPKPLYNYRIRPDSILGRMTPEVCKAALYFVGEVDDYMRRNKPQLKTVEMDWSVRYLCNAMLWAYQCKDAWDKDEYRTFLRETRIRLCARNRQLGMRNMSKALIFKSVMLRAHLLGPLDFIASHINVATSR